MSGHQPLQQGVCVAPLLLEFFLFLLQQIWFLPPLYVVALPQIVPGYLFLDLLPKKQDTHRPKSILVKNIKIPREIKSEHLCWCTVSNSEAASQSKQHRTQKMPAAKSVLNLNTRV